MSEKNKKIVFHSKFTPSIYLGVFFLLFSFIPIFIIVGKDAFIALPIIVLISIASGVGSFYGKEDSNALENINFRKSKDRKDVTSPLSHHKINNIYYNIFHRR